MVGLEVCFGEFLFEFFRRLVLGHFLFVLVGLSESLPGLCELVSAGGVVWVFLEPAGPIAPVERRLLRAIALGDAKASPAAGAP